MVALAVSAEMERLPLAEQAEQEPRSLTVSRVPRPLTLEAAVVVLARAERLGVRLQVVAVQAVKHLAQHQA